MEQQQRAMFVGLIWGAWLVVSCGPTGARGSASPITATPRPTASSASSANAPPKPAPSLAPEPVRALELVGERGKPSLHAALTIFGDDAEWRHPMYDRLFPKRLSFAVCKAQKHDFSREEALSRGLVYPFINAVVDGKFSASRPQKAYRIAITYCTPQLVAHSEHHVRIVEDGAPSLDFSVPPGLRFYRPIDIDGDGLDELVVEWHARDTPQIYEGSHSIISFAQGRWRELYKGRFAQALECSTEHPNSDRVSLTVLCLADGALQVDEQLWRAPCDPAHPSADVGESVVVDRASAIIGKNTFPDGTPPTLAPAPTRPPAPALAADAANDVARRSAATPIEAVCQGSSTACRCPSFTGSPGGTGRASLMRRGSFSGPYTEALVSLEMCEGHMQNWGGTVLVRKNTSGWSAVGYVPGFVPQHCESHRGADGVERLACVESYGLNQGTYSTTASVVDFAARSYDVLLASQCEDARDVRSVRWLNAAASELDVGVSIVVGERRVNTDSSCRKVGGSAHALQLRYVTEPAGYVATLQSRSLLSGLVPVDESTDLDPAVRAGTAFKPASDVPLPEGLRPERQALDYRSID